VAILQEAESIRLTVPSACRLIDLKLGKPLASWPDLKWQEVRVGNPGLRIGSTEVISGAAILEPAAGTVFRVNGLPYRGVLILRRTGNGRLMVINRLPLEEYLVGALTSEVSAGWPLESLKAHAVVSRTMTAHRIWIRKDQEFDMTADTSTHLYHGVAAEKARTRQAVEETRGQVLAYGGELFSATFHANCGGHTEDVAEIWNTKQRIPPLEGVEDPHCRNLKHYRWRAAIPDGEFLARLGAEAVKVGALREVTVTEFNRSGRVRAIRLFGNQGTMTLTGRRFRELLGADRLRSLNFNISISPRKVTFAGFGWGHGVGLCQWGAYGMARQGRAMEEILSFYFPQSRRRALKGLPGFDSDF
jgi:stage II sporulation protein D